MANDINGSVEEEVLDGVLTTDQNFKGDPGKDGITYYPYVDTEDDKKYLKWRKWEATEETPEPEKFNLSDLTNGLPPVTADDNGKILMVVNGEWVVVSPSEIPNLVTYQDT